MPAGKVLSQSALLERTLAYTEEEFGITRKAGKDFMESLQAAIEEALGNGEAVNIVNMVKMTPAFKLGGRREVFKEFGNPEAGKEVRNFPAKIKIGTNALKAAKEALPSVGAKAGRELKAIAEDKAAAAAQRRAERERNGGAGKTTPKRSRAATGAKKKARK